MFVEVVVDMVLGVVSSVPGDVSTVVVLSVISVDVDWLSVDVVSAEVNSWVVCSVDVASAKLKNLNYSI